MRLLIHDTNVLIDLLKLELLSTALSLPYEMETTDLVQNEIVEPEQTEVLSQCIQNGLLLIHSTSEELLSIAAIMTQASQLSIADCSVIHHAQARSGIVVSGDASLRKEAERRKLQVHGTPWLLACMVEEDVIIPALAINKMVTLLQLNPRLPDKACQKLIEEWKKKI
jgi:predicted nucleic acid-binding protein